MWLGIPPTVCRLRDERLAKLSRAPYDSHQAPLARSLPNYCKNKKRGKGRAPRPRSRLRSGLRKRPHYHPLLEGNNRKAARLTDEPLELVLPHPTRCGVIDPRLRGDAMPPVRAQDHVTVAVPRYHRRAVVAQGNLVRRKAHDLRAPLALDRASRLVGEECFSRLETVRDWHTLLRFAGSKMGESLQQGASRCWH